MGRVFVHVGLPKTATSTLQTEYFPNFNSSSVRYIGVDGQRRQEFRTELYDKIVDAVNGQKDLSELRLQLESLLATGKSIILSEEMFTVSQGQCTWRSKLANLARALDGLNYTLIVTVREPTSALFSYYVERYLYFSKCHKNFVECALEHEDMHIYHYKKFVDVLFSLFSSDRIHVFRFEDIVANDVSGLSQLISGDGQLAVPVCFSNQNARERDGSYIRSRYKFTLLDMARKMVRASGFSRSSLFLMLRDLARPLTMRLDRLVLHTTKVPLPQPEEIDFLKHKLEGETAALSKYFGIHYE